MQIIDGSSTLESGVAHVLYSRGRVYDEFNYFEALEKISAVTRRTKQQVEERILNGERKRLKSSNSLKKLLLLETKLKNVGLDVYIEIED